MKFLSDLYSTFLSLLSKLFWLLELFLFLRLVLKFLGANPGALIVNLIYKYSDILVFPFRSIFSNFYWRGYFVEISTISAIIGYGLVALILLWFLRLFSND